MSNTENLFDSSEMEEFRKVMQEYQERYKSEATEFWNNLSYDDKLKAFYYVVSKIYEGDVKLRGSYRYILYDLFSFEMDAYIIGIDCGYLNLHNIIYSGVDFDKFQTAKTVKMGDHTLDVDSKEKLKFSFNEETKELTIKTVDIFKEN
jgi:hypothetical protein